MALTLPGIAIADGRTDFNAHCAGCHGAHGNVQTEKAKALKMDLMKINLKASRMNKTKTISIIENGKGKMPGYRSTLKKDQITAIADYVMLLRRK